MRLTIVLLAYNLVAGQRASQDGRRIENGRSAVTFVDGSGDSGDGSAPAGLGRLTKVYEWKQMTYNIDGRPLIEDRFGQTDDERSGRSERPIQDRGNPARGRYGQSRHTAEKNEEDRESRYRAARAGDRLVFKDNATGADAEFQSNIPDSDKYFIQYNNVPMGVDRWRNKLFIAVPRRRYGIPSTLNYLDLDEDTTRSPGLRPYPSARAARELVSVYRTRVDQCERLWAVDTGMLEIPGAIRQVQPPAVVIFDLPTNRQIHRYQFKPTDLVIERTPRGLASITVDVQAESCGTAHAYIPDLATYGLIVYSLHDNDSWRVSHNYFSFSPVAGTFNVAGQQFSWNDGIFSIALGAHEADGYRRAYFHPMVSYQEFSVSTRVLRNRTLATREFHGDDFKVEGERGADTQSTSHDLHVGTGAMIYAEVGRDAVGCWNVRRPLTPASKVTLAQDHTQLVYTSDLHVTGDEVWLMSNKLPRFVYSRLDTEQYNFRIFRANVYELISGTACEPPRSGRVGVNRPSYSG